MLKHSLIVRALAVAFSTAALAAAVSQPAFAQSNASGNIFGRVDTPAGATIVLNNTDTGLKRSLTPDASGRYTASGMPIGHYRVDLMRAGAVAGTTEVDVVVGQGVDASFGATAVQSVQISGRRSRIDVSNSNNGAVFTARELAALPITQSVDAIIQLAPNTTRADPRYAAGASFGGGGASENSFYINGFPVTNPLTQLGASELPFGAIAQAQILTGGFGAEFGRSIGGVVNITTKSGTNNWETGATYSIEPNSLRSKAKDVYYGHTGDPDNTGTDGTIYAKNSLDSKKTQRYGGYVGGPLIRDKLFMFLAAERIDTKTDGVTDTSDSVSNKIKGWTHDESTTTRVMGKFDWNITDNHRLEYTYISDKPETDRGLSDYNYATGVHSGVVTSSAHFASIANVTPTTGANTNILKYTGNLTDDLTLSALYGKNKTEHVTALSGTVASVPQIVAAPNARAPGFESLYVNTQPFGTGSPIATLGAPGASDTVSSQRMDLEYKLGNHTLRAGFDNNKLVSDAAGDTYAGGSAWVYAHTATPETPVTLNGGKYSIPSYGALGPAGYYVSQRFFSDFTKAESDQSAQYIEDRFQVTKNLLLTFGLRDEQYKNKNGDGETFLEIKNQLNPRFSGVWDVNGDASTKVFGSIGRYSIQIPTHVAVRGASRSTLTRTYYGYSGVSTVDGSPLGLVPIVGPFSPDNELGQAKLAATVAAQNLKPSFQDEMTLGFEHQYSRSLNVGVKVTYRKLRSTIDDWCDQRPFDDYAAAKHINVVNYGGFNCASINPGQTNDFLVDYAGTGTNLTKVSITAAQMGFDVNKPERTYSAVDFFAEHPLHDGWYGRVNYTWARSKGNTEGQTLSAVAQTDVAATETWDFRELMDYSKGLLTNDRTHQIKAFGYMELTPQLTLGGNLLVASGQPEECLGNYPDLLQDVRFSDYGSAYHYCYGPAGANLPSPQGSAGRLPWDVRLDLGLVFKPVQVKGLAFKVDVFNVFNKQTLQQIDETYNTGAGGISSTYGTPGAFVGYTAPRSMKLAVEYNHRF